jgi:hypothetical protein
MKAENMKLDAGFVRIAILDVDTLVRNWWVVLLRGIAGVIFRHHHFFCAGHLARGACSRVRRVRFRGRAPRHR